MYMDGEPYSALADYFEVTEPCVKNLLAHLLAKQQGSKKKKKKQEEGEEEEEGDEDLHSDE
jgi:hypothetical protein